MVAHEKLYCTAFREDFTVFCEPQCTVYHSERVNVLSENGQNS